MVHCVAWPLKSGISALIALLKHVEVKNQTSIVD